MEVSIIIVSYNNDVLLDQCLSSIKMWTVDIDYEIILIENYYTSLESQLLTGKYPDVKWIIPGYNAGFGRANNLGLKQAKGKYILYLNPDTKIEENVILKLYNFYRRKEIEANIGALSCQIINLKDGSLLIGSGKKFQSMWDEIYSNPIFIKFQSLTKTKRKLSYNPYVEHKNNHPVDFISGACFFISKFKIDKFHFEFDEDFFLYYEDVELCYRINRTGLQNYFISETSILHVNTGSTSKLEKLNFQILISKWLFFRKTTNFAIFTLYAGFVKFNAHFNYLLAKRSNQPNSKELQEEIKLGKYYLGMIKRLQFQSKMEHKYLKMKHDLL